MTLKNILKKQGFHPDDEILLGVFAYGIPYFDEFLKKAVKDLHIDFKLAQCFKYDLAEKKFYIDLAL